MEKYTYHWQRKDYYVIYITAKWIFHPAYSTVAQRHYNGFPENTISITAPRDAAPGSPPENRHYPN